ncbi:MAG: acyl-CoA thioesterase [Bacteroidota bacterium]
MSYSIFETELTVRPDDIDMNNHVHVSKYADYVLAARYDQMQRCYKMPMDDFIRMGYGWVVITSHIEYKRPLLLGDVVLIRTSIAEVRKTGVKVVFEIVKKESKKLVSEGYFEYSMVNLSTGRATEIPKEVIERYSI